MNQVIYLSIAAFFLISTLLIVISNVLLFSKVRVASQEYSKRVSILIPARNEERNLEECIKSLFRQGNAVLEILIYDDYSEDRTAEIIAKLMDKYPQIAKVPNVPLPPEWCGKNFACSQLAKVAKGDWLLFIDADARLADNAVNRMLTEVEARNLTFLSCWPKFETVTWAEKILMPMLNFIVFSMYPAALAMLTHPKFIHNEGLGLAHGACMFFERASYFQFGGHARVKDQIFEDTRIAQLWRKSGMRGLCLDGQELVRLRMYSSGAEIWQGFQKNIYPAFKNQINFWVFIIYHFIINLLPFLYLIIYQNTKFFFLTSLILAIRLLIAFRFRQSLLSVIFHPFAESILLLLGISSWWRCKSGKGVNWKGRTYQTSE